MAAAPGPEELAERDFPPDPEDVPILVAAGSAFEGAVSCRTGARIDGAVKGEISARGRIELGESSQVVGSIRAAEIVIAGCFEGTLTASRRIELLATARVAGDLSAGQLIAHEGCRVEGSCTTVPSPDPADQPHSPS